MALRALQGPAGGSAPVGGSGTTNTIPRWTGPSTLGDSGLIDNGTAIYTTSRRAAFGQSTSDARLTVLAGAALAAPVLGSATNSAFLVSGNATSTAAFGLLIGTNNSTGHAWLQSQRVDGPATAYNLTLNEAGGNVGIGTASPISPLHVKGNATNTDGILTLTPNSGGRNHQVQSLQASSLFRIFDQSAGASRLEIDINGNISAATTGGTFNASTTNAGIKLPATPGNTDPNTLDCYADGGTANSGGVTWTPTLKFGGNTTGITYNTQMGRYTRIGNMVFATCYVRLTSKGSATGAATIDGLPTSANLAGLYAAGTIGFISAITSTGTMEAYITPNSSQITLRQVDAAGTNAATTDVNFANTSEIIISIAYSVN